MRRVKTWLSAIANDIAYVDRSSNSLGSGAFETAFAFNMSWIVETEVTFLMTGIDASFNSMLYKLILTCNSFNSSIKTEIYTFGRDPNNHIHTGLHIVTEHSPRLGNVWWHLSSWQCAKQGMKMADSFISLSTFFARVLIAIAPLNVIPTNLLASSWHLIKISLMYSNRASVFTPSLHS